MAWNEEPPRDEEKGKQKEDIWHKPRRQNDGPPDLEALLRRLKQMYKGQGKESKPATNTNKPNNDKPLPVKSSLLMTCGAAVLLGIWVVSGIFIVDPAEQAAIVQFGKYTKTVGPGPHWVPTFIDKAIIQNVDKVSNYSYSAKMLTKDENIVSVSVAIQYRIGNLKEYLFNVADPEVSLQQATASALRQVVGHSTLNDIIAEGREVWGQNVEVLLNRILSQYQAGITIMSVSPQPARAPEEVQDAFDDAINAQEDEKRFKEQAYAYAARVIPIAEGQAQRITTAALAFEQQMILKAEGQTAAFLKLLPEYQNNAALLKQRLYLDTMEKVLLGASKVMVADTNSKNLLSLSLPSDKPSVALPLLSTAADDANAQSALNPSEGLMDGVRSDVRPVRGGM